MFTIKQAARRVGVSEAVLRAWERRYHVVTPHRTESGYRLYDDAAITVLSAMRRLVDDGWSPAVAARQVAPGPRAQQPETAVLLPDGESEQLRKAFLEAAAVVDPVAVENVLQRAFSLGPFEAVAQSWLLPTLTALGDAWAAGWVDVAGEHAAAHAVTRRLSHSFTTAGAAPPGPRLVVALPPGALHELGALTFAAIARRRGLPVVYLGADLPVDSWVRAVGSFPTLAAVLVVPTEADRAAARETAAALRAADADLQVTAGGGSSADLATDVTSLPHTMTEALDLVTALPA